ncbi:MAG: VWA domain-containing protein [Deltaproteobacteria bacterium]|nr:VWA domain-containing protein [Deltaproteobacteria bacterium]
MRTALHKLSLIAVATLWAAAGCAKHERSPGRAGRARVPPPLPTVVPAPDIALLVLIQGNRRFVGDSSYTSDTSDDETTTGALEEAKQATKVLAGAIDDGDLGVAFYASNYIERISMGPPRAVSALDAVTQFEFRNERSRGFMRSVDTALTELERSPRQRKVLVLISDGVEGGPRDVPIAPLVDHARAANVTIHALQVQPEAFADRRNMQALGALGSYRGTHEPADLVKFAEELRDTLRPAR